MAKDKATGLTDKQKRFCEEYLVDLNGTQAAIRSGYSQSTANEIASENLAKPSIQNYVAELKKQASERTQITTDRVLNELAKIAFADIRIFYNEAGNLLMPHELSDQAAAALAGIETFDEFEFDPKTKSRKKIGETQKIKLWDKKGALELLAKHLGLFEKDNSQKSINNSMNLSGFTFEQLQKLSNDDTGADTTGG